MNNPLENFKNPFDIDGSFAQKILNTDRIFGNTNKILGIPEEEQVEQENPQDFKSQGSIKLRRYKQALNYGAYGMECNVCCVMYFLQSCGLIPPQITRKEFEYAFTPLNPEDDIYEKLPKSTKKDKNGIKINGNILKPIESLFDKIFVGNGELFLRGITGGGSIFPNGYDSSYQKLHEICHRFFLLSKKVDYEFLSEYKNTAAGQFSTNNNVIGDCYNILCDGSLNQNYFDMGFTIFVAIDLNGKGAQHYCLIVNKYKYKTEINGVTYYFYPADDPHFLETFVVAPAIEEQEVIKKLKNIPIGKDKLKKIKIITSSFALGVV